MSHLKDCPVCNVELDKDDKCPECGESYTNVNEGQAD